MVVLLMVCLLILVVLFETRFVVFSSLVHLSSGFGFLLIWRFGAHALFCWFWFCVVFVGFAC